MADTSLFFRPLVCSVYIIFFHCFAITGEIQVVLKNGEQYKVKTSFGDPAHYSNKYFSIHDIRPTFYKIPGWNNYRLFWRLQLNVYNSFEGMLAIGSPLNKKHHYFLPISVQNGPIHRWQIYFEFMDSEVCPETWEWVDEPGDSWIPFNFSFQLAANVPPVQFLDWAKVPEGAKQDAKKDLKRIRDVNNDSTSLEVALNNGEKFSIKTKNNDIVRYENHFLHIDSLSPSISIANKIDENKIFAWVLSGKCRNNREVTLEITSPWIKSEFYHKIKIKNDGNFQIPFAFSSVDSEFWTWSNSGEECWIPFKIMLESNDYDQKFEFIEWYKINESTRSWFRTMKGPS